jgi:outer membrane protein OmpA-like peptidoglycan-associated protein
MKNYKLLNLFAVFSILILSSLGTFAQNDVSRRTVAVTYPVDESVMLQFRGTTRFPRMKGDAKLRRTKKNGTEVELSVSKMPRPFELGAGYATYVVWAISPDGQVDNLGEIKRRGFFDFDSKMSVTTPLQTFALIITAEPHFLVRRPSRAIMLENLNPYAQSGRTVATTAAIEYFGNSSDYFNDARTPEIAEIDYSKTPSTVLQAKQAVALAKFAGAQRDAVEELRQAELLMQSADAAWKAGRPEEDVDITARKAISAAVKAEDTSLVRKIAREQRNAKTRQDAEIRESEDKVLDAQSQIADVKAELARETRDRELAERDAQNYAAQVKELRNEVAQLREELGRVKSDAENAKARAAALENEKQVIQQQKEQSDRLAEQQREQSDRLARLQSNEPLLMQSLRKFGTVTKNERGIVLTLPENYFSGVRVSSFAPLADAKIGSLGEVLSTSADYKITIEAHTDNKGTPDELQILTQERAQALMDKLAASGVTQNRIEAKGLGASLPVSPNTTNASRAKNRRVQVLLVQSIE